MYETIKYLNDQLYYLETIAELIKVYSSIEYQTSVKMIYTNEGPNMIVQT